MYVSPFTQVFTLIRENDAAGLAQLLADNPHVVSAKDKRGSSPLILATYLNNLEATKQLIAAGAELDTDPGMGTALMGTAFKGHTEAAKLLVDAGADVNAVNPKAGTALIFAAMLGKADIVTLLLEGGADKTLKDPQGMTAADHARQRGFVDLTATLTP